MHQNNLLLKVILTEKCGWNSLWHLLHGFLSGVFFGFAQRLATKRCYACSGDFPDRDCELYPKYTVEVRTNIFLSLATKNLFSEIKMRQNQMVSGSDHKAHWKNSVFVAKRILVLAEGEIRPLLQKRKKPSYFLLQ